uniref:Uncharacterized protein n=1 Tax=Myoviridae sp. ctcPl3 TaxID=2826669 RepID=A0A8S5QVY9_9CAUD|nr:MAG TPA: hypothetical protein [Myoviridae sp. ctcPl3]
MVSKTAPTKVSAVFYCWGVNAETDVIKRKG